MFTADEIANRDAERGTFVRSGGEITIAASSSEPLLTVSDITFRLDDVEDYSIAESTVELTPNATGYPRRDLIIARGPPDSGGSPTFDSLEGDLIDGDLLAALENENQLGGARLDDEGLPLWPAEAMPSVQPPAGRDLRGEAAIIGMVFLPQGTGTSQDLADEYITDLRKEGIGVEGVLRPGDALAELEAGDDPRSMNITGTAGNAEQFGGKTPDKYGRVQTGDALYRLPNDTDRTSIIRMQAPNDLGSTWSVTFEVMQAGATRTGWVRGALIKARGNAEPHIRTFETDVDSGLGTPFFAWTDEGDSGRVLVRHDPGSNGNNVLYQLSWARYGDIRGGFVSSNTDELEAPSDQR
ncbi:hypothetical protein C447_09992 [Halococcus hamelinensis 100A6]|uniref:Uncharacterized protein n=1 Tax=Halococcus hamelinensis 100A6 TaxID=1132509 RepID=M0LY12_9EURY|nr:hypothetical protein C447_09992 [Halococcus hamelinensis 100A6]